MSIRALKSSLPPEFSAADACELLRYQYKSPLKYLNSLEKKGVLIRLKRGLYTFTDNFDNLAAAGAIHSPSYISFETAMAYYGMIPERVATIMSVVDGRSATFKTPVGVYEYYSQNQSLYAVGMSMQQSHKRSFLIANQEKALLDTLSRTNLKSTMYSASELLEFTVDGLRVEYSILEALSMTKLRKLARLYRNLAPMKLAEALHKKRGRKNE